MIPGRGHAEQARHDRLLAKLRETSGYRIIRAPWGWTAYKPGSEDEIGAETLEELAAKLEAGS